MSAPFPHLSTPDERAELKRLRTKAAAAEKAFAKARTAHQRAANSLQEATWRIERQIRERSARLALNHETDTGEPRLTHVYVAQADDDTLWLRFGAREPARAALLRREPGGWVGTLCTRSGSPVEVTAWVSQVDGDAARDAWLARDAS
jgi:hypothetical protein